MKNCTTHVEHKMVTNRYAQLHRGSHLFSYLQHTCRGEEGKQQQQEQQLQSARQRPLHDVGWPSRACHGTLHQLRRTPLAS